MEGQIRQAVIPSEARDLCLCGRIGSAVNSLNLLALLGVTAGIFAAFAALFPDVTIPKRLRGEKARSRSNLNTR